MPTSTDTTPAKTLTRLTEKEKNRIVQLYTRKRAPLSIRQIHLETGRSYGAVHRVLAAAEGVVIRGQGGTRKKPEKKTAAKR